MNVIYVLSLVILVSSHVWCYGILMKRLIYEFNLPILLLYFICLFFKVKTFTLPFLVR